MTEWLHFNFSLSCIGEGNGNPLQCSCLENPRDGGAWWAAVYAVTQSRTRLKWLSSSNTLYFCFSINKMFFPLIFQGFFSLHFIFCSLNIICLDVNFFNIVILLALLWTSKVCADINLFQIFSSVSSFSFWHPNYAYVIPFAVVPQCPWILCVVFF